MSAPRTLAYLACVPVGRVKGIGPRTEHRLATLGIRSVADLLLHVPRRYLDRSRMYAVADVPVGEEVTVAGTVEAVDRRRISRNRTMITARIRDGRATLGAVWFNPYLRIAPGQEVALSGRVEVFRGHLRMRNPDVDRLGGESLVTGRIVPVHPTLAGLGPRQLRRAVADALARSRPVAEVVPEELRTRLGLVTRDRALWDIHFPEDHAAAAAARRRLVFDELFRLELALALRKEEQRRSASGIAHRPDGPLLERFLGALPYRLTRAQQQALEEILGDLGSPHPMHRLLQGEVGSGKTVVAVAAMLVAVQSRTQAAVMAPTEVLAEQHYLGTVAALEAAGLEPSPATSAGAAGTVSLFGDGDQEPAIRVALVTGNSILTNFDGGRATRARVLEWIADGTVDLVVGTHALIGEGLRFHRLGLAVVDEQHRFGVHQRVRLRDKADGHDPDVLIMTATPIPRTLSMTLYGDLDVSVLDELPPGRAPVRTRVLGTGSEDERRVRELVRGEVAAGRQAFIVCPLVEESPKVEAASAVAEYDRLRGVFPELRLGLLHGQLPPREKEAAMRAFRAGDVDVLVATTVIEVGIDVPNATLMIVEDADRFGLSQLHQLRGRVGRGDPPGTCILLADPSTPEGTARLEAMVATTDGFRLAEEDLRIRGQGTVFGARQAGLSDLRLADLLRDAELLVTARREAFSLVAADPGLAAHPELAEEVRVLLGEDVAWLERS